MPLISRDELKEGFVNTFGISHDSLPADTNGKVTNLFFSATQMLLESNVSVVVEAAFQHKVWAQVVPRWANISQLYFVICDLDPNLCMQRHLERGLNDLSREFYHGDKNVSVFKETGKLPKPVKYDSPSFDMPTIMVATHDGYSPGLDMIRDFIVGETAVSPKSH